ncbi:hypothetical protein AJ78_05563 [Emergomyces pasteurianus Ep9510]|uniref:RNase III domain-containing protein n=1 Tax=Emergomyces pasteurianus Ep9510 TaxID=1447872 RepID=A0A1J9PC29_9EURO|nr:hypothetical protein AJ78_05563 [Emergomyces pasteurianus Ep9510]
MSTTKLAREEKLLAIEEASGYIFNNPDLCLNALRAAGFPATGGNKGLAQVGDSALRLALVAVGFEKSATRDDINVVLAARASNKYLASQGFEKSLDKCVYRVNEVAISMNIMATTVQALLGAVFLDCNKNISVLQEVIKALGLHWPEVKINNPRMD